MQEFRTTINISKPEESINFSDKIMLTGSCFTENIGSKLEYNKLQTEINPFGILYNPESIANSFNILLNETRFTENDLFFENGIWNSFYHHSRFSGTDKENVLECINNRISNASDFLKNANYLIFTFGTAWIYELISSGNVVSNCHKLPSKNFSRRRLSVSEITNTYTSLISKIKEVNPDVKIIFTVSPVRHLKDGNNENQLSKSTLLLAVNELISNNSNCHYFPAYEIMMDDLRDYRFYESDMVHPSAIAVDYIWKIFSDTWINPNSMPVFKEIDKIRKACKHRPFQPDTQEHQLFLNKQLNKINELTGKYPFLDFKEETSIFKRQII